MYELIEPVYASILRVLSAPRDVITPLVTPPVYRTFSGLPFGLTSTVPYS